ncbi:hypothetical protein GW17_00020868 [Ensete ventricosum]|nr:hypothetical protein GW17_00020868 [Ensete ventricosum]RZR98465.1 hypothetical protein BHM03_00027819 [Ensete ventricosum]
MLQERPYNNMNRECLGEEVVATPQALDIGGPSFFPLLREGNPSALTPNHYWWLSNIPRFSPPISNPKQLAATVEAFLNLTHQAQELAGMM